MSLTSGYELNLLADAGIGEFFEEQTVTRHELTRAADSIGGHSYSYGDGADISCRIRFVSDRKFEGKRTGSQVEMIVYTKTNTGWDYDKVIQFDSVYYQIESIEYQYEKDGTTILFTKLTLAREGNG